MQDRTTTDAQLLEVYRLRRARYDKYLEHKHIRDQIAASDFSSDFAAYLATTSVIEVQDGFNKAAEQSPEFAIMYPDHPGTKEILKPFQYSKWAFILGKISGLLAKIPTPVTIAFNWAQTFVDIRTLLRKDVADTTLWDYAGVLFWGCVNSLWTILYIAGASLMPFVPAFLIVAAPYIIATVFGLCALHGLYQSTKLAFEGIRAWWDGDLERRNECFKKIGKQLIGIVINTLACVISIFTMISIPKAMEALETTFSAATDKISYFFNQSSKMLTALASFVIADIIVKTTKMNKETLDYLHPTKIWYALKANHSPISAVKMIVMAPLRILCLGLLPIQAACAGIGKLFSSTKKVVSPNKSVVEKNLSKEEKEPTISNERHRKPSLANASILESKVGITQPAQMPEPSKEASILNRSDLVEVVFKSPSEIAAELKKEEEEKAQLPGAIQLPPEVRSHYIDILNNIITSTDKSFTEIQHAPEKVQAVRMEATLLKDLAEHKASKDFNTVAKIREATEIMCPGLHKRNVSAFFENKKLKQVVKIGREFEKATNRNAAPAA